MKPLFALLALFSLLLPAFTHAANPVLIPAWQSETLFDAPESIVFDPQHKLLFVSNVNGSPNDADGNGYISQLSLDGKVIKKRWLEGLNAPKGMALLGDSLYVADINELIVIDIKQGKVINKYLAPKALFLNDVVADKQGNIYVSDMMTNTIHRLSGEQFEIWLHDVQLEAPNGLLVEDNNLIVGSWGNMTDGFATETAGHLKTVNLKTKQIQSLGDKTPAGNLDGVESDGNGNYFVTDWMQGKLLHITPSGLSSTLISLPQGSADHTVLLKQNLVIIPMMLTGNVLAFEIKK